MKKVRSPAPTAPGKRGLFEVADNGTIFLDEIGELPLLMQAKLLRVLQEQELLRVGGTAPIKINVRVISATNRDLKQMIREQTFREDLFYRLSVVSLEIPPLRERRNDIFPLIQHFITELNNKYGFHKTLTPDAFQVLKSYSFPGNVRELKNCLEEAVVMSEDDRLTRDSFSCLLQGHIVPCADGERPLDDILLDIEYQYLTNALQEEGSIRKAAARLQMFFYNVCTTAEAGGRKTPPVSVPLLLRFVPKMAQNRLRATCFFVVIEKQSNPFIPKRKIFVNILTKMRYSFLAKCKKFRKACSITFYRRWLARFLLRYRVKPQKGGDLNEFFRALVDF